MTYEHMLDTNKYNRTNAIQMLDMNKYNRMTYEHMLDTVCLQNPPVFFNLAGVTVQYFPYISGRGKALPFQ